MPTWIASILIGVICCLLVWLGLFALDWADDLWYRFDMWRIRRRWKKKDEGSR